MGTFADWITEHHPASCGAAPYGVIQAIQQAGPTGISRKELGDLFDLDGQLMNKLLAAYASVGQITASRENGQTVFRSV